MITDDVLVRFSTYALIYVSVIHLFYSIICNLLLSYLNVQIIPDFSSDSSYKLLFFFYASLIL